MFWNQIFHSIDRILKKYMHIFTRASQSLNTFRIQRQAIQHPLYN